jgi:glutaredoxin 3
MQPTNAGGAVLRLISTSSGADTILIPMRLLLVTRGGIAEVLMTDIRLFTKPGCPYCVDAKEWLQQHGCPFEALEITQNVQVLREWRELSGGVGVPVLARGKDLVIGFSPERYSGFLTSCQHTTTVDVSETEAQMPAP